MNIISILRSFLSPDQLVMHADPTRYTPLATVDAHRSDAGAIQPARADILSQFYPSREDDSALVRAFKVLTDVGEEINNLQQELERVKHSKHEFDRINNKLKIAHLKHVEAASSYRYVKTNSIDLMTAFSEYDQAPSLFKRDILWSITRRTIETIIKIESALKELVAAKWELQIEPIVEEPLEVITFDNGFLVNIDDVHRLTSRLHTAEERYLQVHAQIFQTTAGLQANAASSNHVTPLAAVFQLIQYGKDLFSDAQVQQLMFSSLMQLSAAGIASRFGVFSQHSSTADVLEVPGYTSTNSTGYHI